MQPVAIHLVSLGCPKNLVDSEVILGRLGAEGFVVSQEPETSDILMVNTCGFIESAKEESINEILELVKLKEEDPAKRVVVAGCLGQRYPEELAKEIPEIDAIVGMSEYPKMPAILNKLMSEVREAREADRVHVGDITHPAYSEDSRLRLTPGHSAYLKISEGCDNPCTFCSIPSFRGRFRSKDPQHVIREAHELVASGTREINLISQDLTSYGSDIDGDYLLPEIMGELDKVEGIDWIRLLYTYPYKFSDEMIDAVARLERVIPYIDMPIQHIDDTMLKRMGRRMGEKDTVELFRKMRDRIPNLVLRTTFIVGFPGETREMFQKLIDFVKEFRLERVGVFTWSPEEGTPAEKLPDRVPREEQERRREELYLVQQQVAFDWNRERVGTEVDVLLDSECDKTGQWLGRSFAEAPEIDSVIRIPTNAGEIGDIVRCRIVEMDEYDLIAEPVTS
ncbi:MAG: 30S ribosomal protein S12 methylthiotransferase RimO [Planctomycetia bacterium]|nr:30S ribosomal protein S12 methylthiotransferase RimO [Planctomycetia bacterium]NCG13972.1 30S ribosomal protein S12 methylthiotransferase RimO [Planctomycetia bacterium]